MRAERIRILHVQAVDAVGGTERTNFTVLTGMDARRFANEICILGAEGPLQRAYAAAGIPAHYMRYNPIRFARLLLRGAYDFLFLYGLRANLMGRLLGALLSNAVRVEVKHGVDATRGRLARALDRWTAGGIHHFVSNSHAGAHVLAEREGKPREKIAVIHNGIDLSSFAPSATNLPDPPVGIAPSPPGKGLRLIAVANLLAYKGHRFLIEAVGSLMRGSVPCTLLVVGDGPERRALERQAQRVAPECVHFLGRRSDIPALLAAADVLVQPSLSEGLPNSIMEAMAAALPVVATDAGGNRELVRHAETGLLVPAGSAEALAAALRELATDSARRSRMGQAGRERIRRHFPLKKMVGGFETFCQEKAPPSRPDILFITTTGMAVRYLIREEIQALTAAGYRVRVLCGEDAYAAGLAADGLPVDTIKMSRFFRPLADLCSLISLLHYLRKHRPRIVHTCTPKAGLLGPLAARLAAIPSVHTVFGLLFHDRASWRQNLVYRIAERLTALCAGHLLFQSREDLECIRTLGWKARDRLWDLGNGVNLECFNPDMYRSHRREIRDELGYGDEHFVVGIVARLLRTKGLGEFLDAAERLQRFPALKFLVVGPAEANHAAAVPEIVLRRAAEGSNIRFLGERRDMPRLYAAMDLFVLPSYREGLPRSLIEASAMELPVVASDIRGCREVVEHEQTGWLVPLGDVDALVERILECWRNPERAASLGRAGRARVQRLFDEKAVHQRLLHLYNRLIGQPSTLPFPNSAFSSARDLAKLKSASPQSAIP